MKRYKEIIWSELKQRNFEIETINDSEVPWWIEEWWMIKKKFGSCTLYVTFLTDLEWESGTKRVYKVVLSEQELTGYTDKTSLVLALNVMKGNFDEKLEQFRADLDQYLNNRI